MFSVLGDREALDEFGRRLRSQRVHRNLTQAHVAKMVGLSVPTLIQLEKGHGSTSLANVAKVLGFLGMAENLANMVPVVESKSVEELLKPVKQRASAPRKSRTAREAAE